MRGTRLVLNMFELMPEMTQARLGLSEQAAPVRLVRWLELRSTRWADSVITVSGPCQRILQQRSVRDGRITVLPNTHPASPRPRLIPPRDPVLFTHGTLIKRYGVQVAIRAIAELIEAWPNLTLQILGSGEYEPVLVELARDLGVTRETLFEGFLPLAEAEERIRRASLGIVPIIDDVYGRLLVPTKLLAYVAHGLPVVCAGTPAIREYFPADSLAYFTPGDSSGLAAQADRLLRDPGHGREQARRAQAILASKLSWETVSNRYLAALGISPRQQPVEAAS